MLMWTVAIDTDMSELKVMELYCHARLDKRRLRSIDLTIWVCLSNFNATHNF